MARPLASDVTVLARALADDIDQGAGVVLVDGADLWAILSRIQRDIWRELVKRGHHSQQSIITRTVTPSDDRINWSVPIGQVLPDDFVMPLQMWDRLSTDPDTSYVPISNRPDSLPDAPAVDGIEFYTFEDDESATPPQPAIMFHAPLTTRTVRIQYVHTATAITAGTDKLYIPDSIDAMACKLLAVQAVRRGESGAATYWNGEYQDELAALCKVYGKLEERRPRQRRPYRLAQWRRWFT